MSKTPQTDAGRALLEDWEQTRDQYEAPSWAMLIAFANRAIEAILDVEAEAEQQGFDRGVNVGAEAWQQDHHD
jgi:hypothetical protein